MPAHSPRRSGREPGSRGTLERSPRRSPWRRTPARRNRSGAVSEGNARGGGRSASGCSFSEAVVGENEERVKVSVRFRPSNARERAWAPGPAGDDTVIRTEQANAGGRQGSSERSVYRFDSVYNEASTTRQVYDGSARDIVNLVRDEGRNGTVFTYGQTATGKTYTMNGIIDAAAKDIFLPPPDAGDRQVVARAPSRTSTVTVHVSAIEVYNEELRDLLCPCNNGSLGIHEDSKRNAVIVTNLAEFPVGSAEDLLRLFEEARGNRAVGTTGMNESSSRSHLIFRIAVESRNIITEELRSKELADGGESDAGEKENNSRYNALRGGVARRTRRLRGVLDLVDLAGSENARQTGLSGDQKREGGMINQSLLTLSTVLTKLSRRDPGHVNYRDTKLTRILKPSLSGNARISAVCCVTPAVEYGEETRNTLDFAARTMRVTTNAQANGSAAHLDDVGELRRLCEELRAKLAESEDIRGRLAAMAESTTAEAGRLRDKAESTATENADLRKLLDEALDDNGHELAEMESRMKEALEENQQLHERASSLENEKEDAMEMLARKDAELEGAHARITTLEEDATSTSSYDSEGDMAIGKGGEPAGGHDNQSAVRAKAEEMEGMLAKGGETTRLSAQQVKSLQSTNIELRELVGTKDAALQAAKSSIADLELEKSMGIEMEKVLAGKIEKLKKNLEEALGVKTELTERVASLEGAKEETMKLLAVKDDALSDANSSLATLKEECSEENIAIRNARDSAELRANELEGSLEAERYAASGRLKEMEGKLQLAVRTGTELSAQVESLQNSNCELRELVGAKEMALENAQSSISQSREQEEIKASLGAEREKLSAEKINQLENQLKEALGDRSKLEGRVSSLESTRDESTKLLASKEAALNEANSSLDAIKEEAALTLAKASEEIIAALNAKDTAEQRADTLEGSLTVDLSETKARLIEMEGKFKSAAEMSTMLSKQVNSLQSANVALQKLIGVKDTALENANSTIADLKRQNNTQKSIDADEICDLENRLKEALDDNSMLEDRISSLTCAKDKAMSMVASEKAALKEAYSTLDGRKEDADANRNANMAAEMRADALERSLQEEQSESSKRLNDMKEKLQSAAQLSNELSSQVKSLQNSNSELQNLVREKDVALRNAQVTIAESKKKTEVQNATAAEKEKLLTEKLVNLDEELEEALDGSAKLADRVASLESSKEEAMGLLASREDALREANSALDSLKEEFASASSQASEEIVAIGNAKAAAEMRVDTLEASLKATQSSSATSAKEAEGKLHLAVQLSTELSSQVESLQSANIELQELVDAKETAHENAQFSIAELRKHNEIEKAMSAEKEKLLTEKLDNLEDQLKKSLDGSAKLAERMVSVEVAKEEAMKLLASKEAMLKHNNSDLDSTKKKAEIKYIRNAKVASEMRTNTLEKLLQEEQSVSMKRLKDMEGKLQSAAQLSNELSSQVESLQNSNSELQELVREKDIALQNAQSTIAESKKKTEVQNAAAAEKQKLLSEKLGNLDKELEEALDGSAKLADRVASLESSKEEAMGLLASREDALREANSALDSLQEEFASASSQASEDIVAIANAKAAAEMRADTLEASLKATQSSSATSVKEAEEKLHLAVQLSAKLSSQVESLQSANIELQELVKARETAHENAQSSIAELRKHNGTEKAMSDEKEKILTEKLDNLEDQLKKSLDGSAKLAERMVSLEIAKEEAMNKLASKEAMLKHTNSTLDSIKEEATSASTRFSQEIEAIRNANVAAEMRADVLERSLKEEQAASMKRLKDMKGKLRSAAQLSNELSSQVESLQHSNSHLQELVREKDIALENAHSTIADLRQLKIKKSMGAWKEKKIADGIVNMGIHWGGSSDGCSMLTEHVTSVEPYTKETIKLLVSKEAAMKGPSAISQASEEKSVLRNGKEAEEFHVNSLGSLVEGEQSEQSVASARLDEMEGEHALANELSTSLQSAKGELQKLVDRKEMALKSALSTIAELRQLEKERSLGAVEENISAEKITDLENQLKEALESCSKLTERMTYLNEAKEEAMRLLANKDVELKEAYSSLATMKDKGASSKVMTTSYSVQETTDLATNNLQTSLITGQSMEEKLSSQVESLHIINSELPTLTGMENNALKGTKSASDEMKTTTSMARRHVFKEVSALRNTRIDSDKSLVIHQIQSSEFEKMLVFPNDNIIRPTVGETINGTSQLLQGFKNESGFYTQLWDLQPKHGAIQFCSIDTEGQLKKRITQLENDLQMRDQKVAALKKTINETRNTLDVATRTMRVTAHAKNNRTVYVQLKKHNEQLLLKLAESEAYKQRLKANLETFMKKISNLKQQLEESSDGVAIRLAEKRIKELEIKLKEALDSNSLLSDQVKCLQNINEDAKKLLRKKDVTIECTKYAISDLKGKASNATTQVLEEMTALHCAKISAEGHANTLQNSLDEQQIATTKLEGQLHIANDGIVRLNKENAVLNKIIQKQSQTICLPNNENKRYFII